MHPLISHQSIISVLLLNNASLCQALVQKVQQSQGTTQHSQSISNVSTVYSDQRPDQLLNYQECQRHASVLENGSQEDVHVNRIVLHTTSS